MLTKEEVKHIANLARLRLSEEEITKFSSQLSNVFEYVDLLKELNTDNVEITAQVTNLSNVYRKDEVKQYEEQENLLKSSPFPVERRQIKVPGVFD
jgi:aspartyl-tRNA(Asn)/glutamyl-tRNA(Gln) amidotransferase subunit C